MLNAPVYIIGVLLLVIALAIAALAAQKGRYELLERNFETFKSQTRIAGLESANKQKSLENAYLTVASELRKEREEANIRLNQSYADYDRLRKSADASGRRLRSLAEGAGTACRGDSETRLAGALEQLEAGVLRELAQPRDAAIIELGICNKKLDQIRQKQEGL